MQKISIIVMMLMLTLFNAQVGINTASPEKMLDINGSLNVRKEVRNAGTSTQKGNAGTAGQLFKLQNTSGVVVDSWKTTQIANGTGSLSLFYLNTVNDKTGINYSASGTAGVYLLNALDTSSVPIDGAVDSFNVTKTDNKSKAVLSFQTTVQISTTSGAGQASFACGIFLKKDAEDFKLRAVRNDVINGNTGALKIYNINATLDGLQAGSYKVKVACYNRTLSGTGIKLGIGQAVDTAFLNADMAQSTLTTSVLQSY